MDPLNERRDRAHFDPLFDFAHLPESLRRVSEAFAGAYDFVVDNLPENAETTTCCRKLLEAKDCAVRARVIQIKAEAAERAKTSSPG